MPLFFILSGYCFKDKYLESSKSFITKRIKKLWWPYLKWMLLFMLLRPLFFLVNFYTDISELCAFDNIKDIVVHLVRVLFFVPKEPMLGALWFLPALMFANILGFFIIRYASKREEKKMKIVSWSILISLLITIFSYFVIGEIVNISGITLYRAIPFFTCFYLVGYWMKQKDVFKELNMKRSTILLVVSFVFCLTSGSMTSIEYWKVVPYFIGAVIGTLAIVGLAKNTMNKENAAARFMNYTGDNSMTILIWHFFCFKFVSLTYCYLSGTDMNMVGLHPTVPSGQFPLWIFYVIAGVGLPLLVKYYTNKIYEVYTHKLRNV